MLILFSVGKVDLVALLGFLDDIKIDLDSSPMNFLPVHLQKGTLGCLMCVELYVSKAF